MPQHQVDNALGQLVHAELIFQRGIAPDAEYTFKHALVQDVVYSTLLRSRRQQIHARIATTLEDKFAEIVTTQPAAIAQHCAEGGLTQKAVSYWLKAGQQSAAKSAMTEAVSQLNKGVELLSGLSDSLWRQQAELDLQAALGPALIATKGYSVPAVGQAIARTRTLAERLDRPEYLFPLLYGQCACHVVRAEHKLALSIAREIEKYGDTRQDAAARLLGHSVHGFIQSSIGEFDMARTLFERCRAMSEPEHRARYVALTGADQYVAMLAYLGTTLMSLGQIDQARTLFSRTSTDSLLGWAQEWSYGDGH